MRIEFKPSFERSFKALIPSKKQLIKEVVTATIDILSRDKYIHEGIGLKHLRQDYWEVRQGLKVRVLFRWHKDLVEFVLVGDHEDIKRFLRSL